MYTNSVYCSYKERTSFPYGIFRSKEENNGENNEFDEK